MATIDLNADVGEGAGADADLMPLLSSANIACGGHAGDATSMQQTLALANECHVVPGAHPGFPDRENFGRREMQIPPAELRESIYQQMVALRGQGAFTYVKPHGALYNMAARDESISELVVGCIKEFDASLGLLALANSVLETAGRKAGLRVAAEAFVDRRYDSAGRLVSRTVAGAVIESEQEAVAQAMSMVLEQRVKTVTGDWIRLEPDSLCVHGDTPGALAFVRRLQSELGREGVEVKSCWDG